MLNFWNKQTSSSCYCVNSSLNMTLYITQQIVENSITIEISGLNYLSKTHYRDLVWLNEQFNPNSFIHKVYTKILGFSLRWCNAVSLPLNTIFSLKYLLFFFQNEKDPNFIDDHIKWQIVIHKPGNREITERKLLGCYYYDVTVCFQTYFEIHPLNMMHFFWRYVSFSWVKCSLNYLHFKNHVVFGMLLESKTMQFIN